MSATATAPKRTSAQILSDLRALPFATLDKLMPKIIAMRVQKHPQVMSPREQWLQQQLEAGLPAELRAAWKNVSEPAATPRRRMAVVQQMEAYNVTWLEWALELATRRGLTVSRLLQSLAISRPDDVCA